MAESPHGTRAAEAPADKVGISCAPTAMRLVVGLVMFISVSGAYLFTNTAHVWAPVALPMTRFDLAVPFVGWTVLIYLSYLGLVILGYWVISSTENLNRFVASVVLVNGVSLYAFVFAPTKLPREGVVLLSQDDWVSFLFRAMHAVDAPNNCTPSLHVSMSFLCALSLRPTHRALSSVFFGWAVAIAISTMTTKQHYFVDVVGGAALAAVAYWAFFRSRVSACVANGADFLRLPDLERKTPF